MPFSSDKQQKFLEVNKPDVAEKFSKDAKKHSKGKKKHSKHAAKSTKKTSGRSRKRA